MLKPKDIVSEVMGDWGRWQRRTVILIYLCKIPSAWFLACIIFTAPTPKPGEYYCRQPEDNSIAEKSDFIPNTMAQKSTDSCFVHSRIYKEGSLNDTKLLENEIPVPCMSFQFNSTFETIITKFELVCQRSILIAVSQSLHSFGVLLGGILARMLMEMYA